MYNYDNNKLSVFTIGSDFNFEFDTNFEGFRTTLWNGWEVPALDLFNYNKLCTIINKMFEGEVEGDLPVSVSQTYSGNAYVTYADGNTAEIEPTAIKHGTYYYTIDDGLTIECVKEVVEEDIVFCEAAKKIRTLDGLATGMLVKLTSTQQLYKVVEVHIQNYISAYLEAVDENGYSLQGVEPLELVSDFKGLEFEYVTWIDSSALVNSFMVADMIENSYRDKLLLEPGFIVREKDTGDYHIVTKSTYKQENLSLMNIKTGEEFEVTNNAKELMKELVLLGVYNTNESNTYELV